MEATILKSIDQLGNTDSSALSSSLNIPHEQVCNVLKSFASFELVVLESQSSEQANLTPAGKECESLGSPEGRLFEALGESGEVPMDQLKTKLGKDVVDKGMSQLLKKKVAVIKAGVVTRLQPTFTDVVRAQLSDLTKLTKKEIDELKSRKLVTVSQKTVFKISKGPKFNVNWKKPVSELTKEMIASGAWKSTPIKKLNLQAKGAAITTGHLHPLLKVRSEFRQIFLEMGFEEMPTNSFVENSFWNFDALFQPQGHPARDAHDTFFLTDPAATRTLPTDYVEKVREAHEKGAAGSIGWQYDWSEEESRKNILRTHTTAVSSRMLYKLAQEGFKPKKYFSIDRVFRNESLDATHLAEFHQVEGLIADYNIGLVDLMGILSVFFQKLGIRDLHFKPAYNPYTEPSMEIFGYHTGLGKLIEIGNSGIFRPEMLIPMGLPPNVTVIAWGLSLERPTMIKYGISNIRSMIGYNTKIASIQESPICHF